MSRAVSRDDFGAELGYLGFVQELRFLPNRKYRWDFALPAPLKIAVEYQGFVGGSHGQGDVGHASIGGMLRDQHKWSLGALDGWLILLVNAKTVGSGEAMKMVYQALTARGVDLDRWLRGERTA